jgi:hypothetical protein
VIHKDIILCLIAIKTITAAKKILSINYGFKELISKQILNVSDSISISLGFQNSVKTVCQLTLYLFLVNHSTLFV